MLNVPHHLHAHKKQEDTLPKIISFVAKILGILIMAAAFLQWITFDYPDVNPFWPGAIFVPGVASQFLNWIIVSIIGSAGYALFFYGKSLDVCARKKTGE